MTTTLLFEVLMGAAIALGALNAVLLRREERRLRQLTEQLAQRPCALLEAVRMGAADQDWLLQTVCGHRDQLCDACRDAIARRQA